MIIKGIPLKIKNGARMAVKGGGSGGCKAARAVVATNVDLATATKEGDGEVFGGGFDVLLVAGYSR